MELNGPELALHDAKLQVGPGGGMHHDGKGGHSLVRLGHVGIEHGKVEPVRAQTNGVQDHRVPDVEANQLGLMPVFLEV